MFVLLFAFVFGGAIEVPGGGDYTRLPHGRDLRADGCLHLRHDLHRHGRRPLRGLFDRFRSLPMARSAVLAGRTFADLAFAGVTTAAMALTGLLVGWRTDAPAVSVLGAFALLALFAYSFLWIGAVIGLSVRSVEVAQTRRAHLAVPPDVPVQRVRPAGDDAPWLQPVAAWNPISAVAAAVRELFGNVPPNYQAPDYWPLAEPGPRLGPVVPASAGDLRAPGVARYRRAASR